MKKTIFKKSISLMLTVLMILSCWVFVAPEHAHAVEEISDNATLTAMAVIYSGEGDRAPSGKIVICSDGELNNTTVGVAKFNIASVPSNIISANLHLTIGNHGGAIPSSAKIYMINPDTCTDVTSKGQLINKISTVYNKTYTGTAGAANAYNHFRISESQSLGEIWQNQTGAKVFDLTAAVETARANGWNELCLAFIMPKVYNNGTAGKPDWSDIHIGTDAYIDYKYYNYAMQDFTISTIEELGDEVEYYETYVTGSAFYTNMENNYIAYNDAKRYYDAVVYGGVPFDAALASKYYSALHSHMWLNTGENKTYINYLNTPIYSRAVLKDENIVNKTPIDLAYRKNVIWYDWDFSYDMTQNGKWLVDINDTKNVKWFWTVPNTIIGILDDDTTTFPFHSFFFTAKSGKGIRSIMIGEKNSDKSVDTSKFYFENRTPVSTLTHTTSGFAEYGSDEFGDWSYGNEYASSSTISNETQDQNDEFTFPASTMYQVSNYVSVNNENLGVNSSNIYVATPLDEYVTFRDKTGITTKKEWVFTAEDYGNYGYAHAVYMQTYKDNYENWKNLFPNLSYKNYDGYVFASAPSVAEELDSASALSLAHGLTESDRTADNDTISAKVSAWATNVNTGANHLKNAKTTANSASKVTNKYVDLIAAIKAADSIYANDQAKYTPATWSAFASAYEAARAHMASLNPDGSNAQYSSDATTIGNLATALATAQAALQYVTVTYKYYDGTVAKTLSAANGEVLIGTTAAELASNAPANTATASAGATKHYVYSWPTFNNVTDSATYQETREEKNHDFGDWIVDSDSDCQTEGQKHRICKDCNYREDGIIGKTQHTLKYVDAKAPTCTENGNIEYWQCTACNKYFEEATATNEIKDIVVLSNGHTEETIPAVESTCTSTGLTEGKKCSVCGEILVAQTVTDKFAHTPGDKVTENAVESTCSVAGSHDEVVYCTECDFEISRKTVTDPLKPHTEETIPAVESTCTSTGLTEGKKCSVCDEILVAQTPTDMKSHDMSGDWITDKEPTCITAGSKHKKCANCDYIETEAIPETGEHVYGKWTNYTATEHSGKCTSDIACTATITEAHTKSEIIKIYDSKYHYYKCEKCDAYGDLFNGTFTANVKEECYGTGTTFTQIEGNDTQHKETCKCGNEKNDAHSYGAWYKDPENKTDKNGQMSRVCSECSYKQTTTCNYKDIEKVAATCTANGYITWECSDCKNGYTEILYAPGHDEVEHEAKTPTCTEIGWDAYVTCSRCNHSTYVEKAAIGHTFGDVTDAKDATCEETGNYAYKQCTECSKYFAADAETNSKEAKESTDAFVIPANGHKYGQWIVEIPATCIATGTKGHYDCSECDKYFDADKNELDGLTIDVDKNAHINTKDEPKQEPTCTEVGYTAGTLCEDCHNWISGHEEISAIEHKNKVHHAKVDATCVAEGTIEYWSCPDCGKNFSDEACETVVTYLTIEIAPDNHVNTTKHEAVKETCLTAGYTAGTYCNECHNWISGHEEIPATAHKNKVHHAKIDATCVAEGTIEYWSCPDCKKNFSDEACETVVTYLTIEIAPDNHVTTTEHEAVKETCLTVGYTAGKFCEDCKNWISGHEEIPAIEHKNKVHHAKVDATCVAEGTIEYWSCPDCKKNFSDEACETEVANLKIEVDAGNHKNLVKTNSKAATCDDNGNIEYWTCEGCHKIYRDEQATTNIELKDTVITAKGHDYGDWTFVADGEHKRVCKNDANHIETENCSDSDTDIDCKCDKCGNLVKHNWGDATCDVPATCTVCGAETGDALGHDWNATTYNFAEDGKSCTATRSCKRNGCTYSETATAESSSAVKTPATCTVDGWTTYTATFDKEWAKTQSKDVQDITAINHDWNETTYTWSTDGKTCEATRECKRENCEYSETTKAEISSVEKTPATCTVDGWTTYTATFDKEWAKTQSKDVQDITALNHDWNATTYNFAEDGKSCTATRSCKRNGCTYSETATAESSSAVKTPATCTVDGWTTYTATFDKDWAETQSKDVQDIPAINHDWNATTYNFAEDGKSCTATRTCKRNGCTHSETAKATISSVVKEDATCEDKGTTTYTATFTETWAVLQTKDVQDIPAIKHDYDTTKSEENLTRPVLKDGVWSKGYYTYACKNNSAHKITEDVDRAYYVAYESALAKLNSLLATDITDEARDAINKVIEENKVADNLITTEQPIIDAATAKLEKAFEDNNESLNIYTVTFKIDGSEDIVKTVISGENAEAPTNVTKISDETYHYSFSGWDRTFTNVTSDLVVTAQFKAEEHSFTKHININDATYHTDECACGYTKQALHTETSVVTVKATCEADGIRTYTCSLCGGTRTEAIGKRDHVYKENGVETPATCSTEGVMNTICTNVETETHKACAHKSTKVIEIDEDAHDWNAVTYTWSTDGKSCTAQRVCKNNAGHIEAETETATSSVTTEATCIAMGKTTYTATFNNDWAKPQTTTRVDVAINPAKHTKLIKTDAVESTCSSEGNIEYWTCEGCHKIYSDEQATTEISAEAIVTPKADHDWKDATYTWSTDGKTCTAQRVCKNNVAHVDTADATATSSVTTEATCIAMGKTTYTATFNNDWAKPQTTTRVDINENPAKHTKLIKTDAVESTCSSEGNIEYWSCEGCKKLYSDEQATTEISAEAIVTPKADHDWKDATYTWSADGKTCTAQRVCNNNAGHVETATAKISSAVKTPATCTVDGWTTYTATFDKEWAKTQTKDVQDITAPGHKAGEAVKANVVPETCGEDGSYDLVVNCSVCGVQISKETIVVPATGEHTLGDYIIDKNATCTSDGSQHKECSACDYKTEAETIPASGHSFDSFVTANAATCLAAGNEAYKHCGTCDLYFAVDAGDYSVEGKEDTTSFAVSQKDHSFTGEYRWDASADPKTHSQKCVNGCGDYGEATECTFESTLVDSSCVSNGYVLHKCTVCGGSYKTDSVEASGHNWSAWEHVEGTNTHKRVCANSEEHTETVTCVTKNRYVSPTCEVDGISEDICTECNYKYNSYKIKAHGHKYIDENGNENAVIIEPGCTTAGSKYTVCLLCGEKTETILYGKPTGHYLFIQEGYDATCTETGLTDYKYCIKEDCDYVEHSKIIEATGHKDDGKGKCKYCGNPLYDGNSKACNCLCHKDSAIMKFIYKIVLFFWKLFKINKACPCGGVQHY